VFAVIARVKRALEQDGQPDRAREFVKRAFESKSYDEVLALAWSSSTSGRFKRGDSLTLADLSLHSEHDAVGAIE